jgi:hypothetical protein
MAPTDPVVDRGRHQQHRSGGGQEEAQEERHTLEVICPPKPGCERHCEQKAEQYLRSGQREMQLVEKLNQLPVRPLYLGLLADVLVIPSGMRKRRPALSPVGQAGARSGRSGFIAIEGRRRAPLSSVGVPRARATGRTVGQTGRG